jgi:hypothetical protein
LSGRFEIDLRRPSLFDRLLKPPQGLLVDQDNYQKVWSQMSDDCRRLLPQFGFCLTPVFVRDKPIGLFYAGGFPDDEQREKSRYQQFKKIGQATAHALEPPVAA